jgi:hypothetical protein
MKNSTKNIYLHSIVYLPETAGDLMLIDEKKVNTVKLVDESQWLNNHLIDLMATNVENAEIAAQLDFAVIYLLFHKGFYAGKFHLYLQWQIVEQLVKYRPDLNVTAESMKVSLERCVESKRLVMREYPHDYYPNQLVKKYIYNANYQGTEKVIESINPFTSPDFVAIQEKIKEILS